MSNHSRRALKRTGAAIVAALAGATGVAFVPGTAGALPGFEFTRINGDDRYATAADIALAAFPGGTTEAILATGEAFPDALAGNYLAGALGAPILLAHHDDVPESTLDALDALGVTNVTLLGGTGALDDGVAAELAGEGYTVDRISGINRYDTAKLIAVQGGPAGVGTIGGAETAIVTTGENFPDALAIGPVAYDESFPVLLTPGGALSPSVGEAIDELNIEHVIILGGTVAVSTAVENTLGAMGVSTERIEGENRFATAAAIADRAVADFGFGVAHVNVAFGRNFPDALAGGPLGGEEHAVTLLTDSDEAPTESCTWLEGHATTLATGHALGGTNAINNLVLAQLRECAGAEAPNENPRGNQDYNSTPSAPVLGVLGTDGIARQEYTFSDILPGTKVDITFIPCFAESIGFEGNPEGTVEFADDPVPQDFFLDIINGEDDDALTQADYLGSGHGLFQLGNDNTNILFVNGEVQPGPGDHYVDDFVVPASGTLVVEYVSIQSDCVIPLVFDDTAGDDTLNLEPDTNLPTDAFAVGGAFIASNGEAASGQEIDGFVMFNNAAEGWFVLDDDNTPIVDGNVFFYDDTDEFQMEGGFPPFFPTNSDFALSHAEWQTYLSPLDEIDDDFADQDYSRSAGNVFEVDDDYAGTVRGVQVTMGDFDDIPADTTLNDARVTWDTPDPVQGWITDYEVDIYDAAGVFLGAVEFDSDDDPEPDTVPEPNQDVDNDNIDDDVDNSLIIEDLPLGTFQVVVHALTATGDESLFGSEPSALFSSPGAPGAPLSLSVVFTEGLPIFNPLGVIGIQDTITITFNEIVNCVVGSSIDFRDGDGTTARLVNGTNAAFAGCGTNTLTISVNPNPTILLSGADGIIQSPADIIASSGITDATALAWNIIDSPDVTIA